MLVHPAIAESYATALAGCPSGLGDEPELCAAAVEGPDLLRRFAAVSDGRSEQGRDHPVRQQGQRPGQTPPARPGPGRAAGAARAGPLPAAARGRGPAHRAAPRGAVCISDWWSGAGSNRQPCDFQVPSPGATSFRSVQGCRLTCILDQIHSSPVLVVATPVTTAARSAGNSSVLAKHLVGALTYSLPPDVPA